MLPFSLLLALGVPTGATAEQPEVQLSLTLLDAPFNLRDGYQAPSMQQSLDVAWGVDRLTVLGLQEFWTALLPEREGLRTGLGIASTAAASGGLMFVGGWMHEEWHRAVMTWHGASSRNGIYHPEAWSNGTISVDQVADHDLAALKAESPGAFVRLMSAGMEGEQALVDRAGDELFFHGGAGRSLGPLYLADSWTAPLLAITELSPLAYLAMCAGPEVDGLVEDENARMLEPSRRDFTGPDCTAWVRDLHRPDEAYEDRGVHPTGEGVDRYVGWSDLNAVEQDYLRQRFVMQLLNFVNPHLYGINGVRMASGEGDRWVAGLGHSLAPWGYVLDAHGAVKRGDVKAKVVLRNGVAEAGWFPGLDLLWVDQALPMDGLVLDAGLDLWLQPEGQRFDAAVRKPGGRLHARLSYRAVPWLDVWAAGSAKTEGWVPGEVSLEPSVSGNLGVTGLLGER